MVLEDDETPDRVTMELSDPSQLMLLRAWLEDLPEAQVALEPGTAAPGELGAIDVLTVLAGSGGLVAAVKVLPEFIRSRRTGFHIQTTVRGQPFTLNASNIDDVLPILERLLGD